MFLIICTNVHISGLNQGSVQLKGSLNTSQGFHRLPLKH